MKKKIDEQKIEQRKRDGKSRIIYGINNVMIITILIYSRETLFCGYYDE